MGHRWVKGLKWARALDERPSGIPVGRARGVKALGVRYERALAKELGSMAEHGPWFEFEDDNGRGWCQPDFLLPHANGIVVLESKYSWVAQGHTQIWGLYQPVLEKVYAGSVIGVVVCRNLRSNMNGAKVTSDLDEAIHLAAAGPVVLHWIGVGPLRAPTRAVGLSPLALGL